MDKEFYKHKTSMIKALANPVRLMIVDCLRNGEKTVSELIEKTGEEQSTISKNLGILKSSGLIKDRKVGLNVFYSLKVCCLDEFFSCIDRMILEQLEQQQSFFKTYYGDKG